MESRKITFENQEGQALSARLDLPVDEQPIAYALFAHCFTCSKNLKAVANISRALAREGIAVLRFDFTGLGESEGEFADTNFSSNVADLVAAAEFLADTYEAPKILVGHSLGGTAVLQAAADIPAAQAVATIAAPCQASHVAKLLDSDKETIEAEGEAVVTLAGRSFKIKKQFLDDLEETRMQESIRKLRKALLIFHSPIDNTVGISNAGHIFEAAKHPKSFVSLDQADHLLSREGDSRYAGSVIGAWARKYIDAPLPQTEPVDKPDNQVFVRTEDSFRTEVRTGWHSLVADEPESVGGTDLGPNPYDYLLTALGTCTSMTLRMYADRKKWPLEAALIHLDHSKIHVRDCEDCISEKGKIDTIEREIELIGPLDAEQRQRLLEIADRCPVHRTLHAEVKVRSKLK